MTALSVFIRGRHAGRLEDSPTNGRLMFTYAEDYQGPPLSHRIRPGAKVRHADVENWFAGILPDREVVRQSLREEARITSEQALTMELLTSYGLDLPGAVQTVEEGKEDLITSEGRREPVNRDEIGRVLENQIQRYAQGNVPMNELLRRWSLGGGQPKLALAYRDGKYYACSGREPSTVIVKPGVMWDRLPHQCFVECLTMNTAQALGLDVADTRMEIFGDVEAIVIERFDRALAANGETLRIHQEDMCQATGTQPDRKYVEDGGPVPADIASVLDAMDDPEESRWRFAEGVIFNHLTNSPDCHAKNHALLHFDADLTTFAPLFDIASMLPYEEALNKDTWVGMPLAGKTNPLQVNASSIKRFARIARVDEKALQERAVEMAELLPDAAAKAVEGIAEFEWKDEFGQAWIDSTRKAAAVFHANVSSTRSIIHIPTVKLSPVNYTKPATDGQSDSQEELRLALSPREAIAGNITEALNQKPDQRDKPAKQSNPSEDKHLSAKKHLS